MKGEESLTFVRARTAVFSLALALALAFGAALPAGAASAPEPKPADPYAALEYRFIGPPGNRVSAVAGVPGDLNTYYAGAASGGVWKSTDGGVHWKPVFDDQPAQSIGSIAIAPSDPNVIWVGTGESFIRSNVSLGNGVYRSTDAGKSWMQMGLEKTGRIGRVVIDPRNPDVVFVAALGTCYGPQPERGVYRTTDGGKTWKRITGHGLPEPPLGKIAVAVAASNPQRVYALIETGQRGSLWRSDDGGEEWKLVNQSRLLNERPHYYTRMLVMPDNASEVYFPSNGMGATYDGGETTEQIRWGGDNHDMWADSKIPSRMMIGNDGGVQISTTRGKRWSFVRLPVGQIYHVTTDNRIPYRVYGQMQDDGSMRGPSHNPGGGGIPPALWTSTAGCETGWATPDPVDADIVWGGCYAGVVFSIAESTLEKGVIWAGTNDGLVQVTRDGGQHWANVTPNIRGLPPKGTVGSVEPSRFDAGTCYVSVDFHQVDGRDPFIYKTTDYGKSWTSISSNIPKSPLSYVHVVREDPFRRALLYAGTENALYVSFDDGKSWQPLQSKLPHAPVYWLTVQEQFHDLVVATYGRGFYILDDVTPLTQLTEAVRNAAVHLFEPRPAYRFRAVSQPNLAPSGTSRGKNPSYGALINTG